MKQLISALALGFLYTACSFGQIGFGVKGGVNFATIGGADAAPILKTRTGFAAGVYLEASLPFLLTVQPEALYTTKGFTLSSSYSTNPGQNVTSTNTYSYLEIPVLLKYSLPVPVVKPSLYVGPEMGFLLSAKNKLEVSGQPAVETKMDSLLSSTDFGLVFGASAHVLIADIEARYTLGLKTTDKSGQAKLYNRVWSIMAAIPLF
jgi:hypothetical protein